MFRLLIVDDEPASIRLLKKLLDFDALGVELMGEAEDGSDALAYINSSAPPDIVILDMEMPVMNGVSLLKYIVDCHEGIEVIVVSGYFDYPYTHAAIQARVREYLIKPVDPTLLSRAVRECTEALRQRRRIEVAAPVCVPVDAEAYRDLLLLSDRLREALRDASPEALRAALDAADARLAGATPEFSQLAQRIFTENLTRFLLTEQRPAPQPAPDAQAGDAAAIRALYTAALEDLIRARREMNADESVGRVREYIQDHYRETLHLEILADRFYIRKQYLATLFQSRYGQTIGECVVGLKFDDARKQLEYSDRSIREIAQSVGFEDVGYFNRQFKKHTGMSPTQYRRLHRH